MVEVGEGVNKYAVGDRVSPIPMPGYHHVSSSDLDPIVYTLLPYVTRAPTLMQRPKARQLASVGMEQQPVSIPETCQYEYSLTFACFPQEFMVVDQEDLVKIPSHMSYEEASTLPIACGTAWNALYGKIAQVQSGDTVLCMGTGGVSLFTAAVRQPASSSIWRLMASSQIALTAGAKVIVTSSSDKKLQAVKDHLAPLIPTPQAFQTINYATHKEWDQEVDRLTNGEKVDFLLDIAGSKTFPTSIKSTKRGGLISLVGILSNQKGDLAGDGKSIAMVQPARPDVEQQPPSDIAQLLLFGGPIVQGITCCTYFTTGDSVYRLQSAECC